MESFLLKYFRRQGKTKNVIKRLLVEIVFSLYVLIMYIPLKILEGVLWFIETGTGMKYDKWR